MGKRPLWWAHAHSTAGTSAGSEPQRPGAQPGTTGTEPREIHQARQLAESFGADPERYDRARPRYPGALAERVIAASPGPEILDVGTGTGIAARQFQAAGARVLGVEPDARMADFARRTGVPTEVATFEDWDSAGRHFDAVIAGQAWHWVDPVAGAAKAARVLRPGGRIALFWYVFQPAPELAQAFADVYHRAVPTRRSPAPEPADRSCPPSRPTPRSSPGPPTALARPARSARPSSGASTGTAPTPATNGSIRSPASAATA